MKKIKAVPSLVGCHVSRAFFAPWRLPSPSYFVSTTTGGPHPLLPTPLAVRRGAVPPMGALVVAPARPLPTISVEGGALPAGALLLALPAWGQARRVASGGS